MTTQPTVPPTEVSVSPADAVDALTLEQQAALSSGADFVATKALGAVPSVTMVDGPAGLRMQDLTKGADHLGLRPSLPATAFPSGTGLAQSWDPELVGRVARAIGTEARAAGANVVLGPAINMKRDPRAGRNFEYYSEDPHLTGVLASSYVTGLQSTGVGASLKHFAANNTEHERFRSSSDVDERTLREIYLRAFQRVVQDAEPWTVMCSYNRLNGVPVAENRWLLHDVLRAEWGFTGAVVSDWGAVDDRVASVHAGVDLEMPANSDGSHDRALADAVENGLIDAREVRAAAERVAELAIRTHAAADDIAWDEQQHHDLAREAAAAGIVLLQNDETLPLSPGASVAVIGHFATVPRAQGGGSSFVNALRMEVPLEEIRKAASSATVAWAQGFDPDDPGVSERLRTEAVAAARAADVAVVFLGLAGTQEAEGFDRDSIALPADQLALLAAVRAVQPDVVVVLSHGGALELTAVTEQASAILDAPLLGQGAGGAIADVLFGVVNPSGRLGETLPERLQDVPAFGNFPGEHLHVRYGEGLFVGYRWYDARDMPVAFPFGHGLSYTSFDYSDLELDVQHNGVTAHLTVTNTGSRAGREVVQLYTGLDQSTHVRPVRELKAFTSVHLEPGEQRRVRLHVRRDDLGVWDTRLARWTIEPGSYRIDIGASSRDVRSTGHVDVAGEPRRVHLTLESSIEELLQDPVAGAAFKPMLTGAFGGGDDTSAHGTGIDILRMIGSTPVRRFVASLGGAEQLGMIQHVLDQANAAHTD
ncbi:beta-glucosidase [Curtobacterium sp. MCJR17_055]|uniref:glycoside hydrolase family 3 C-terminal domain-containing protein n=1 Tax=unclassified Curtobacterium TaxID=257496 RepID=UPI000D9AAE9A|nr:MULTISPECIES: glycoside hydrolase family 3 C-terminal domain-containing protein [unclassified Curtobacterium]PYY37863.1 beta-glucosidase [Curtobacterium sp. MCBD17_029]PYY56889.1 beta-glucosidase [Curtobacterium sp. MCJR17_055]PYY62195.1 beta-glucosidase [Curtobacterium sp. MCPF17_015]